MPIIRGQGIFAARAPVLSPQQKAIQPGGDNASKQGKTALTGKAASITSSGGRLFKRNDDAQSPNAGNDGSEHCSKL